MDIMQPGNVNNIPGPGPADRERERAEGRPARVRPPAPELRL
ncbi:hypothetical protein QJS66_21870 [Kocuria rhizophila]|nr:hypothetical protein QJS66_21870 [Kocuria rhizophila]